MEGESLRLLFPFFAVCARQKLMNWRGLERARESQRLEEMNTPTLSRMLDKLKERSEACLVEV